MTRKDPTMTADQKMDKAARSSRLHRRTLLVVTLLMSVATGCRQRMADQPYYRALEYAEFFADGRASRPLERGVIHRGQHLETDPLVTGLTPEEWLRAYEYQVAANPETMVVLDDVEKRKRAIGAPRFDQRLPGPKAYVEEFPFPITQEDLHRGQQRYTIFCAVCHGTLGNGQGKIWERGYLIPTSFHTVKVSPTEADVSKINPQGLGKSRGYWMWGIDMPMDQAPIGYYFEVITKGYGGMPSYHAQIPPDDRWRIIAYIRVLQMSQNADPTKLPAEIQKLLASAGGKS